MYRWEFLSEYSGIIYIYIYIYIRPWDVEPIRLNSQSWSLDLNEKVLEKSTYRYIYTYIYICIANHNYWCFFWVFFWGIMGIWGCNQLNMIWVCLKMLYTNIQYTPRMAILRLEMMINHGIRGNLFSGKPIFFDILILQMYGSQWWMFFVQKINRVYIYIYICLLTGVATVVSWSWPKPNHCVSL